MKKHENGVIILFTLDYLMRQALFEAQLAKSQQEVPVGALVFHHQTQQIIARAHNQRIALADPTAHAEVLALRFSAQSLGDWRLSDCTLYVTLEPCAMCTGAIIYSRIPRVVFGAYDSQYGCCGSAKNLNNGDLGFCAQVIGGVMEADCRKLLDDHFSLMRNRKD